MLKSKKFVLFSILFVCIGILLSQAGWCVEDAVQQAATLPADIPMKTDSLKVVLGKFAMTMGGVLVSLLVVWAILSIYKNFSTGSFKVKPQFQEEKLGSPKNVDEAIAFFINRNRLR